MRIRRVLIIGSVLGALIFTSVFFLVQGSGGSAQASPQFNLLSLLHAQFPIQRQGDTVNADLDLTNDRRAIEFLQTDSDASLRGTSEPDTYPYRQWGVEDPVISAPSAYIYDSTRGRLLFEKNSLDRRSIASLTKIVTAVTLMELKVPLGAQVKVSKDAVSVEGRAGELKPGETFTVKDLMQMMLIASSNDAAWLLAEFAGTNYLSENSKTEVDSYSAVQLFVDEMNNQSRRIGMLDSRFTGPVGFDSDFHYSTAMDLGILAEYVDKVWPQIWGWSSQSEVTLQSRSGSKHKVENTNGLVRVYDEIKGSKTGFTSQAGESMVVVVKYGIHDIIFVLLGSKNREEEMQSLLDWVSRAYIFEEIAEN